MTLCSHDLEKKVDCYHSVVGILKRLIPKSPTGERGCRTYRFARQPSSVESKVSTEGREPFVEHTIVGNFLNLQANHGVFAQGCGMNRIVYVMIIGKNAPVPFRVLESDLVLVVAQPIGNILAQGIKERFALKTKYECRCR